jgi:adenylate cyclase class 2
MPIEIEKKYRLTNEQREQVLANLKELDAQFLREDFETNLIYGGGILEYQKSVLRIRKTAEKSLLTYKRNIINQTGIKHHIEHETEIADAEAMAQIIESLECRLGLIYEKRRQIWNLQNIEVVLDELPFGMYMEIEGKITDIGLAEMLLEIEDYEVEPETYPKITFDLGEKIGDIIEARFKS